MTIKKYFTSAIILTPLISFTCFSANTRNQPDIQNQDTTYSVTTRELKSNRIPDSVFAMTSLKHLHIQGMDCDYGDHENCWDITEIPARIRNLRRLTTLSLNVNAIQAIPVELAELKDLKTLDLDDNVALSSVDNIEKVLSLEYLYLNGCSLKILPEKIANLRNLKELYLIGNHIDKLEQKRIKAALPGCIVKF